MTGKFAAVFSELPVGAVYIVALDDLSGGLVMRKISVDRGAVVVNAGPLAERALALARERARQVQPGSIYRAHPLIALFAGRASDVQHTYAPGAARESTAAALAGGEVVRNALRELSTAERARLAAALNVNPAGDVDALLSGDPRIVDPDLLGRMSGAVVRAWKAYAGAIRPMPVLPLRVVMGGR